MAARGRKPGTPKTGGRKKGTKNKKTAAMQAEIKAAGLDPLTYMLKVMRDVKDTPERRLDAAKAAAPYVHARLASVEIQGDMDLTVTSHEDALAELEAAALAAKSARKTNSKVRAAHG